VIEALPSVNAALNTISALCLLMGWRAIRAGRKETHARFMGAAAAVSTLFLISYLTYHYIAGSTKYTGEGALRTIYFVVLISHVILAAAVVPLVITTIVFALRKKFDRHKRIARWTLPIWLYVSVTGVVVYLMLYRL
jgi:uncharacterized membrane protein YozB (DUF420 family)